MGHARRRFSARGDRSSCPPGRHGGRHCGGVGRAIRGGRLMLLIAPEMEVPAEFEVFRRRAYELTGLDLTLYKAPQMHRRLSALLTRLQVSGFGAYTRLLEQNPQRRQEFRDYVTINVSEFFRDADRFGDFERHILPDLLSRPASLRI